MNGTSDSHEEEELALAFGPFVVLPRSKVLLESNQIVRLGVRAFDILLALLERPGEVLTKRELMARGWPDTFVEESNLRVHVGALRKLLGDGQASRYIVNVSGRGYSFVAPVAQHRGHSPGSAAIRRVTRTLPAVLTRLIGQDAAVSAIRAEMGLRRAVTVVGPGGIGKSTVALTAAQGLLETYQQNIVFVDLSAVVEANEIPTVLATALGVSVRTTDPIADLVAFLAAQRGLIILDNCEQVIAPAAALVERVLRGTSQVDFLATSREPLMLEAEWVYRLQPLSIPPAGTGVTAAQASQYASVQLFTERAAASIEDFAITDENATDIVEICRRLDGLPLAIELAAARVDTFGVAGLRAQMHTQLLVLNKGRRTAQPRHQSLRALLDWSYGILTGDEQRLLQRLSVFRGAFTEEGATAIAGDLTPETVLDSLLTLAAKSLLVTDVSEQAVRYRMLHISRAYAFDRLAVEPALHAATLRSHADFQRRVLESAEREWEVLPLREWISQYGYLIDDVRAALEWAFSTGGNAGLGAALTIASLPFGLKLCLIDEFTHRLELALKTLSSAQIRQKAAEARLAAALAALYWNRLATDPRVSETITHACNLAAQTGIARLQIEPLTFRVLFRFDLGDYTSAVIESEELTQVAGKVGDPLAVLIADSAAARAYHLAGDHQRALLLARRVLRHPARAIPLAYSQAAIDKAVSMRIILARILWMTGEPDEAGRVAADAVRFAERDGPLGLCHALALGACPIALWRGARDEARAYVHQLLESSRRFTLGTWETLGTCFESALGEQPARGTVEEGAVDGAQPISVLQRDLLATLSDRWLDAETLRRAESGRAGWCTAEILRAAATREWRRHGADVAEVVEQQLGAALAIARKQNVVAWELRIAIDLAQLWAVTRREPQARALLEPVIARIEGGAETSDMQRAMKVFRALGA